MLKPFHLAMMAAIALPLAPVLSLAQTSTTLAPTPVLTTYIVTRADQRKCAYPFCGGVYVKAVNQALTRCADGTLQKDCHAVMLDTTALGWSEEQHAAFESGFNQGQALVRGTLGTTAIQSVKADVLTVTQAWQGQALSKPAGTFYAVQSTGVVCITTPCPSLSAIKLNSTAAATNPDLDLNTAGASDDQILAAQQALGSSGILVAGTMVSVKYPTPTGGTRRGSKLLASEFYLPAKP